MKYLLKNSLVKKNEKIFFYLQQETRKQLKNANWTNVRLDICNQWKEELQILGKEAA